MTVGETVLARVNGGQFVECEVVEIHGDMVRVSGLAEIALVRELGRSPLGIAFPIHDLIERKKAKSD
jgi:hypothetical protein